MAKGFIDLIVWQKAHQLVLKIYKYTKDFPKEERYGLTDDMRRAARSVPTNIVEGYGRNGFKDALKFFNTSEASLEELKYHTLLSFDLNYISKEIYLELTNLEQEVGRLLNGWMKSYRPLQ
jgi:four helix bundle protein